MEVRAQNTARETNAKVQKVGSRLRSWCISYSLNISRYVVEFAGTVMLAASYGFNEANDTSDMFQPLSVGFCLIVVMYSMAVVSGAHFNPAVSIAVLILGKEKWWRCLLYIAMQVFACLTTAVMFWTTFTSEVTLGPRGTFTWRSVAVVETFFSAHFIFVYLNCVASRRNLGYYSDSKDRNQFFGLAIGFAAMAGMGACIKVSGGILHAGLALGLAVVTRNQQGNSLFYATFHLTGSLIGVLLFLAIRSEECCCGRSEEAGKEDDLRTRKPFFGDDPDAEAEALFAEAPYPLYKRLLAEFIGALVVSMTTVCGMMSSTATHGFSIGSSLMSLVYSLVTVSGGHLNPAVTMAVILSRRSSKCIEGFAYIAAQLAGGMVAGLIGTLVVVHVPPNPLLETAVGSECDSMTPLLDRFTVILCEGVATLGIGLVTLTCITSRTLWRDRFRPPRNFQFALAIGFSYSASATALRLISGGELNQAVSVAISTVNYFEPQFSPRPKCVDVWAFLIGETLGGVAAPALFMIIHPQEYSQDPLGI